MSCGRFPQCRDCAFEGVEPAICDECHDADQFEEADFSEQGESVPLYYHDWKNAA